MLAGCGSFSADGTWVPSGHCEASLSQDVAGPTEPTTRAEALQSSRDYYALKLASLPEEAPSGAEFLDYDRDRLGIIVAALDAALDNLPAAEANAVAADDPGWAERFQVSAGGPDGTSGYISLVTMDEGVSYTVSDFSVTGPSASGRCS